LQGVFLLLLFYIVTAIGYSVLVVRLSIYDNYW